MTGNLYDKTLNKKTLDISNNYIYVFFANLF